MSNIIDRLRNPPLGTETSERNLMVQAADEIEKLSDVLKMVAEYFEMLEAATGIEHDHLKYIRAVLRVNHER